MTAVASTERLAPRPAARQATQFVPEPEQHAVAAPQVHEVAKPLIQDLSWLDQPEDDDVDGPAIYVTSYYEPVAGQPYTGGGPFAANADPSLGSYQPTFQQATFEQPAAQFAGGPMPLETPGMERLPPLDPNAPPPGVMPPSVVLKRPPIQERIWGEIRSDYANFYSWQSLAVLGVGFGVGAIMANTSIDQHIRDSYQNHVGDSTKKAGAGPAQPLVPSNDDDDKPTRIPSGRRPAVKGRDSFRVSESRAAGDALRPAPFVPEFGR